MKWTAILLLILLTACEHRPLVDLNNTHYIRVYLDEEIQNVTYGFYNENRRKPVYKRPTALRLTLCDPSTGEVVTERFLQQCGEDERGFYFEGHISARNGHYNLMVYSHGTETALIRNEQSYFGAEAYTNPIARHYYSYLPSVRNEAPSGHIVYEPDHLFLCTCERIHIRSKNRTDTLRNEQGDHFTAPTCVQSYYIQVRVKGVEYISTAASLLTGLSPAVTLHDRAMQTEEPVHIFFEMNTLGHEKSARNGNGEESVIYTTFNTFGKLPEVTTELEVTFDFVTTDGRTQTERMDITPMFDTPQVIDHKWIIIDKEIVIDPPTEQPHESSGGLSPEVSEWEDRETDFEI